MVHTAVGSSSGKSMQWVSEDHFCVRLDSLFLGNSTLTLNPPQQAATKKSEREARIAEWTLKAFPLQVMVRSEPSPVSSSLETVRIQFGDGTAHIL